MKCRLWNISAFVITLHVLAEFVSISAHSAVPSVPVLWSCNVSNDDASFLPPSLGSDGTVYATAFNRSAGQGWLYEISPSGKKLWEFQSQAQIYVPAVISDDD